MGSSEDWLTMLRVFGHGLCAWRYSNPALNPWSAPWMLRIGDRLPSTRSKSNHPTVMQFLGSKMLSASHSNNDSAVMGLIAAAEAMGNAEFRSPMDCLTLGLLRPPRSSSAPGTPLRNQFVAARWGAAGFRSRGCRLALQHSLGWGRCCLHRIGGLYRGTRFFSRAVGPYHAGDRPPERAVCGGWRRSRMEIGWLAGRPDSGQRWIHSSACAYRSNAHAGGPIAGPSRHIKMGQHRQCSAHVHHPLFTYNQPSLTSNVPPVTSSPCHKVQGLQTAIT